MERSQIVALVGPNGSGKSTLLNILMNLLEADSGEISILGQTNQNPGMFRNVSYMQDNTVLYDYLTGYDHLQFIGEVQGISQKDIIDTTDRIGITDFLHKKISKYSLGMKQLLLLAMAIVNKPELLVLDEPLNGLDPTNAIKVRNLFLDLAREGTGILLSSHNLSEIDRVTSTILFLHNGILLKEDLSVAEQTYYALSFSNPEAAQAILQKANFQIISMENRKLTILLGNSSLHDVFALLHQKGIEIEDIEKKIVGSEDRYQAIFENKETAL